MTVDPPGVDLARLRTFLDGAPVGIPGPGDREGRDGSEGREGREGRELSAEVVAGGKSNLTYILSDGESRWVLRRPPLGHVLATAHDMGREYTVLSALAATGVPVPGTIVHCDDAEVLGAPFYVMEYVEGTVYRTPEAAAGLGPARAVATAHALIDVLADLHEVDPASVGLAEFGRPEGFLDRQLRRWRQQLDASRSRPLPGVDELHAALAETVPDSGAGCVVHGDYRLDNVLIGPDDRVAAVLDWEMATLGDPLTDLGLFLVYWDGVAEIPGGVVTAVATPDAGFPSGAELVARYAERRGADLSRIDWYVAFGFFKLAVIAEGIHHRFTAGQTVGSGFDKIGHAVVPLITAGTRALGRDSATRGLQR